jgi:MFS family permease
MIMPQTPDTGPGIPPASETAETESRTEGTNGKVGTFSSLRIPNFRYLLAGTTLSNAAQWIQQVTLSWLVYDITSSGTMLGTVNLVRSISAISMIPLAGILIDHLKRRDLLMANNGWLFFITAGLGVLLVLGHDQMIFIFLFAVLGGFVGTIEGTLRQVLVFDLVPRSHTPNGMALIQTGWSLMRSFGPAIGSFLLVWTGAGGNFLIQAGAYALIVITIVRIKFPDRKSPIALTSPLKNIKEGLSYIRTDRTIRAFMLLGFILPLLIIPIYTILPPIYAVEVFGDTKGEVLGLLMAFVGVGGIIGGFVTASLGNMQRRGLLQLGALFMVAVSLIFFAMSTSLPISLMFLAFSGFFEIIFLTTNQTMMQLAIPDNLRGRVTSVINLNMAIMPLGSMLAGIGSDLFGGPKWITIVFAGVAIAVVIFALLFSPTIRNYRLSQGMDMVES